MPNEMKYGNVDWPEDSPIEGERLATNGGIYRTAYRDTYAGCGFRADNEAYLRARETVRYGTLTPDAGDDNFPDYLVQVSYTATGSVTEISLSGVTYDAEADVFNGVPRTRDLVSFKDGETEKTATNTDGSWSVENTPAG